MRGKRSKQYRKLMQQYGLHFGFREPYQVLLDAEILQDAARFKMDFLGGLEKTLHGPVKPLITQCCIRHLYNAQPKNDMIIEHAKGFERRRCNHHMLDQPLSTFECLSEVLDPKDNKVNKHRYVVASQDARLRAHFRRIPGVPMVYLKRSVMIMEPMAGATEDVTLREERSKFRLGLKTKRGSKMDRISSQQLPAGTAVEETTSMPGAIGTDAANDVPPKKTRKRGPSAPNPLSVKKSKKMLVTTSNGSKISRNDDMRSEQQEIIDGVKKTRRKRRTKTNNIEGSEAEALLNEDP